MNKASASTRYHFSTKLVRLAALSSGSGILLVCGILFFIEYRESKNRILEQLQVEADIVAANSVAPLMFDDRQAGEETLSALQAAPNMLQACTFDAEGKLFACYHKAGVAPISAVPASNGLHSLGNTVELVQPVRLGEQLFGTLVVHKDLRPLYQHQIKRAAIALLIGCIAIIFSIVLANGLKRRLVQPLFELLQTARKVSRQDYSVRARAFSKDEFGDLTLAINQMLDRIEERDRRLLEETERAKAAEKAKGSFLSNMSHEVRTPLNGILGMIALLLETKTTPQQHDMLQTAQTSGRAMTAILNDILDLSKIEVGMIKLEVIDFDFHSIVGEVLELFADVAHPKGVEVEAILTKDVPRFLQGDPTRIRQILTNLLSNAIKFTSEGHVLLHASYTDGQLEVVVEDTGIGIPKDKLGEIFENFTQADDSVTRKFGGTGLGLALCQRFVELMEGTISADSTPGAGSQFRMVIPLLAGSGKPDAAEAPADATSQNVLLVNLPRLARRTISQYLRDWQVPFTDANTDFDPASIEQPYTVVIVNHGDAHTNLVNKLRDGAGTNAATRFVALGSHKDFVDNPVPQTFNAELTRPVRRSRLFECVYDLQPKPAKPRKRSKPTVTGTYDVLVVEDNLVNQKVALAMLKNLGCTVTVANDGLEATNLLKQRVFDLVFMDCQMPVMDGLQATRKIRERERASDTSQPIVAMTAHAMEEHRQASLAAGMNDHITKPASKSDFARMLNKWCAATSQVPQ